MARKRQRASPSLPTLLASLSPDMPPGRERDRIVRTIDELTREHVRDRAWSKLFELRAWAWQCPLFAAPEAPLRSFLRRWEAALLSGAPLHEAAALVRDDVAISLWDACDRLAARACWADLQPLLADDRSAWSVAEARVLHGELLAGCSPASGMPLYLLAWEPMPNLPHYGADGMSWSGAGIGAALARVRLPAPRELLEHEPQWDDLLAPWAGWDARVVAVAGTCLEAVSSVVEWQASDEHQLGVGRCTIREAIAAMQTMHGMPAPYTEGRGMVAARRVVWRLLAALTETSWPPEPAALSGAIAALEWSHYDPALVDAERDSVLFLAVEHAGRGRAWATHAWVCD